MFYVPKHAVECDWIEVYVPYPEGKYNGCRVEHYDRVEFWKDEHGDLFIYKGSMDNPVVYHEYRKYVTKAAKYKSDYFEKVLTTA